MPDPGHRKFRASGIWATIFLAIALALSYLGYCLRPFLVIDPKITWQVEISQEVRQAISQDLEAKDVRFPAEEFSWDQYAFYLAQPLRAKRLVGPTGIFVNNGGIIVFCNGTIIEYTLEGEPVGWVEQGRATMANP